MKQLKPGELTHFADTHRGYRHVVVDNDVLAEEIMAPGYWVHFALILKVCDKVDIMRKDMSLVLNLRVVGNDAGLVKMRAEYVHNDLEAAKQILADRGAADQEADDARLPVPEGYKVGFVPAYGHYVQLLATGKFIYQKCASRTEAIKKAMAHAEASVGKSKAA